VRLVKSYLSWEPRWIEEASRRTWPGFMQGVAQFPKNTIKVPPS
jgi:hypothetical protein